ncbi:hypothetical protein BM1_07350 [Bipolaris maydis]|nr:hypothetical protein BM1_07350 [Bipolaris maydis]
MGGVSQYIPVLVGSESDPTKNERILSLTSDEMAEGLWTSTSEGNDHRGARSRDVPSRQEQPSKGWQDALGWQPSPTSQPSQGWQGSEGWQDWKQ